MKKTLLFSLILFLFICNHSIADTTSYPSSQTESISYKPKFVELCEIPGNEADHTLF